MKARLWLSLLFVLGLSLATTGVYALAIWLRTPKGSSTDWANVKDALTWVGCGVATTFLAWTALYCFFLLKERRERFAHMDRRHALLDLAARAIRVRHGCGRVQADAVRADRLAKAGDRDAAKALLAQAEKEWASVLESAKAIERDAKANIAADPQLAAAFNGRTLVFEMVEAEPSWSGVRMWAPAMEKLSQQLVLAVDAHDGRWKNPD